MKRTISLLLIMALTMTLLSGCAGGQRTEETEAVQTSVMAETEATTQPATEPTTEPTLSPEEQLLAALPEKMKAAYEAGIVDLDMLAQAQRECTIAEAAQMLQNAYTIFHGAESKLMADILAMDCGNEPAYLGWIGRIPISLYMEGVEPEAYQDYEQWMKYMVECSGNYHLDGSMPMSGTYLYWDDGKYLYDGLWGWYEVGWTGGMRNRYYKDAQPGNALLESCAGQGALLAYGMQLYDRTTGEKVLSYDGNDYIDVEHVVTVEEMAEIALKTYHSFNPPQTLIPYEECTTANESILTAELLSKETSLPDASCSYLPSEWHGVIMDELFFYPFDTGHFNAEIYEYEIQAVKDAGFNYIGLQLDFSWLQCGGDYWRKLSQEGYLDKDFLEKLDQIIACCIERDIHLDLRATGVGGCYKEKNHWSLSEETAQKFAAIWKVLAQRYADVPNAYLSFTVMDGKMREQNFYYTMDMNLWSQKDVAQFLTPAIESIREISPDRCIILDITNAVKGDEAYELGVALSADLVAEGNGFFDHSKADYLNHEYHLNMQWPYNGTYDAESLINQTYPSWHNAGALDIAKKAAENGLGFMISSWGAIPRGKYPPKYPTVRYPDETYEAFITDVAQTLESYGFGWCYEEWYGTCGITYSMPLVKNVTYEQIGDYPMYFDTAMLGWFRQINGAA